MATVPIRLAQLKIKNYRSFPEEQFDFESFSLLIGKNGSGKSNVLDAVEILLAGTGKSVQETDYWKKEDPLVVEGTISGIAENLALCSSEAKGKAVGSMLDKGLLRLRRKYGPGVDKPGSLIAVATDGSDAKLATGIDAELKRLMPEPIFIRALADAADAATGKTSSPLGQLLGLILSEIEKKAQPELDIAFATAAKLLNIVDGKDARVQELINIEKEITSNLEELFTGTSASLRIDLPNIKKILGEVTVDVNDGVTTPYFRKGQGIQRALYLSILRALGKVLRQGPDASPRPVLLLIEEPELFLHPTSQEQMRDALLQISNSAQVIASTHSASMLSLTALKQLVFIDKVVSEAKQTGQSKKRTADLGALSAASEKQLLLILDLQRASRIFFHTSVLLLEGPSDVHLFTAIGKVSGIDRKFFQEVAIIECEGKGQIVTVLGVLKSLGINATAIVDDDFIWNGAGTVLKSHTELSQLCAGLTGHEASVAKRKALAADSNLQGLFAKVAVALLPHGIQVLSRGNLEDYVGLTDSSKSKYLERSREIIEGNFVVTNLEEIKGFLVSAMQK